MVTHIWLSSSEMNDPDIYIGVKGSVVCLDHTTGKEQWKTHLKSSQLTTLKVSGDLIIAHTKGELYGLDRKTGRQLWNNPLTGLGYGYCIIASDDPSTDVVLSAQQANDAAAASGGGAGAS